MEAEEEQPRVRCTYYPNCENTYADKSRLGRHLKLYHKMQPFVCINCNGRQFWFEDDYTEHVYDYHRALYSTIISNNNDSEPIEIDEVDSNVSCTYSNCSKSYVDKVTLGRHLKLYHGMQPFICADCNGRKFWFEEDYLEHVDTKHENPSDATLANKALVEREIDRIKGRVIDETAICKVFLPGSLGIGKWMLVDKEDYARVTNNHSWNCRTTDAVPGATINGRRVSIANFIMNGPPPRTEPDSMPLVWDHKSRAKFDNSKLNFLAKTDEDTHKNRSKSKNNTSGKIGVSWHKRTMRWMARSRCNGKPMLTGCSTCLERAGAMYNAFADEQRGTEIDTGERNMFPGGEIKMTLENTPLLCTDLCRDNCRRHLTTRNEEDDESEESDSDVIE